MKTSEESAAADLKYIQNMCQGLTTKANKIVDDYICTPRRTKLLMIAFVQQANNPDISTNRM